MTKRSLGGSHVVRAAIGVLMLTASTRAVTVTWIGGGFTDNWDEPANWSTSSTPGTTDDVIHNNGDVIVMNATSGETTPVVIKSFTCYGSEGGGLVIQTGKHLRVNGHFLNQDAGADDRYNLTIEANSTLKLIKSSGAADLTGVNVTMAPVTVAEASKLLVDGAIIGGQFIVDDKCLVKAGLVDAGADSEWTEAWTISDQAKVVFENIVKITSDEHVAITVEKGSTLTVLEGGYGDHSSFFEGPPDYVLASLVYGQGNNTFEMGSLDTDNPTLEFDCDSFIKPLSASNGGSLNLKLLSNLIPHSNFSAQAVREGWDSRNVDVTILPFDASVSDFHSRYEMISPNLESYFAPSPVVFLDVPCLGMYRDFLVPAAGSTEAKTCSIADEYANAYIDDFGSPCTFSFVAEAGMFRNITIGDGRSLLIGRGGSEYGQIQLYYFGMLTIDSGATIYSNDPETSEQFVVTETTTPSLSDLITPACGTIYGDWNGDCEITTSELEDLRVALQEGPYNPLYDSNCDGELTASVERAKAAANYLAQPTCDCGGESMMFGGGGSGGSSSEEIEAVAAWLSETMSSVELAQFLVDLVDAIAEHEGQPIADEMTALLAALGG